MYFDVISTATQEIHIIANLLMNLLNVEKYGAVSSVVLIH